MDWLEENMNSIVLGNSYELIKEISDNSIDCIYTDIPYLYKQYGKQKSEIGKRITQTHIEQIGKMISGIDLHILDEFTRVMKKINCFIWCSKMQIPEILNYFVNKGCNFEILVWCKTNPMPLANNSWLSDIEYCLYFREKGVKVNDGYELKSKYYISPINKDDKALFNHPTIKPTPLVKQHLSHVMQAGNMVLDPFSGSGTTCVCAKELGFDFMGIEINKEHYKTSVDRLNGIASNGQTSIFTDFEKLEEHT